jgi:hypothetical protein
VVVVLGKRRVDGEWSLLIKVLIVAVMVGLIPCLVVLGIARRITKSLEKVRRGLVQPLARRESSAADQLFQKYALWAQSRRMEFLGAFRYETVASSLMVVWKCPLPSSYFCVHQVHGKQRFEFISIINEETGTTLTTSSTHETFIIPQMPGSYAQSFPGLTTEDLRVRHAEAQAYLFEVKRTRFDQGKLPLPQLVEHIAQQRVRSIRQRTLSSWYCVWWYFVSRLRWGNKTVEQQHRVGLWR